jgi:hypothetical protein
MDRRRPPSDVSPTSISSPEVRQLSIEQTLLSELVTLPDRMTPEELILWIRGKTNGTDRIEILDALSGLTRSGLARQNGEVIEPTFAAIRAEEIFNA